MRRALGLFLAMLLAPAAAAQDRDIRDPTNSGRATIWDLALGSHASELGTEPYADFACGTAGGPPSTPLSGWTDFSKCRPDAATGLHEVHFRYDDEAEYLSRAVAEDGTVFRSEGTTEFSIPLIVSVLFDDDGFLRGRRVVTDPRVETDIRERGSSLSGRYRISFGEDGWSCADIAAGEGETPYRGNFIKQRCTKEIAAEGVSLTLEKRYLRKEGQLTIDPVTRQPTNGLFVSETRLLEVLAPLADPAERLARLTPRPPTERELLSQRAANCPGCDLAGVDLKRARLAGANLAGADLRRANLHGVDLSGADLAGANLAGANLNRADLRRAKLAGANFSNAYLFHALLGAGDLKGANFTDARAGQAEMARIDASNALFIGTDLRLAALSEANLANADLSGSRLNDAQLGRADLTGASVAGAQLWRTRMTSANLTNLDARLADFSAAVLRDTTIEGADFSGALLRTAIVEGMAGNPAKVEAAQLPAGFPRRR